MSALAKIQQDFAQAFFNKKEAAFIKHIQSGTKLSSRARLHIYKSSITQGLAKSLRETFYVCEKLVGEDFFNGLAYTFIAQQSSDSPDISDYGRHFPTFIQTFSPAKQLPYLADVCMLCWYWHCASRTKAHPLFDIHAFAKLSETQQASLIFLLPPSAHLLESAFSIDKIWQLCHAQDPSDNLCLDDSGVKLLIWRNQQTVMMETLTDTQWALAHALLHKTPLRHLQTQVNTAKLLPDFLRRGWLAGWEIATE